jgi:hypothetical protein
MTRLPMMLALAMLGGMVAAGQPARAQTQTGEILYTVRRGDTLIALAQRGFKREADYTVAQRYNRVANPRALRPGSVLRLPIRLLRTQPIGAKVAAFRGAATVGGEQARIGMDVREGMEIRTDGNAFLAVELADGSLLTLPSRSLVRVARLHRIVLTGDSVKKFMLSRGRTEAEVQPLKRGDKFEIGTPVSVAAVRGTRFRVSLSEEADGAGTGVLEGNVAVAAGKETVSVPSGKGIVASATGTGELVALLPKPTARDPDRLQDEELVVFRVEPVQGAARYRVQLGTDAGFIDTFAESESEKPEVSFSGIPNGSFFARFTALSREGIEGFPAVSTFERRQNSITAEAAEIDDCPARRCLRFRWRAGGEGERRFHFQIAAMPGGVPIVDQAEMSGSEIILTDLPGGTYYWRVESSLIEDGQRQSKWTEYQELRVAPMQR